MVYFLLIFLNLIQISYAPIVKTVKDGSPSTKRPVMELRNSKSSQISLSELDPATEYIFRISANNKIGDGNVFVITEFTKVPGKRSIWLRRCRREEIGSGLMNIMVHIILDNPQINTFTGNGNFCCYNYTVIGHQYSAIRTMQSITFKSPLTELRLTIEILLDLVDQ